MKLSANLYFKVQGTIYTLNSILFYKWPLVFENRTWQSYNVICNSLTYSASTFFSCFSLLLRILSIPNKSHQTGLLYKVLKLSGDLNNPPKTSLPIFLLTALFSVFRPELFFSIKSNYCISLLSILHVSQIFL